MRCSGIYALYWWEQDLVYIGLSQDIDARHKEHLRDLAAGSHSNYKVQSAFNRYGSPSFIVIETCSLDRLASREIYWTEEFNALGSRGLCLVEPGVVGYGTASNNSKYSRLTILRIFSMLSSSRYSTYTNIRIAARCKVPAHIVSDIRTGRVHLWLQSAYPVRYSVMQNTSAVGAGKGLQPVHAILQSPEGVLYTVSNIRTFILTVNNGVYNESMHKCFRRVLSKSRRQYMGWRLLTTD